MFWTKEWGDFFSNPEGGIFSSFHTGKHFNKCYKKGVFYEKQLNLGIDKI